MSFKIFNDMIVWYIFRFLSLNLNHEPRESLVTRELRVWKLLCQTQTCQRRWAGVKSILNTSRYERMGQIRIYSCLHRVPTLYSLKTRIFTVQQGRYFTEARLNTDLTHQILFYRGPD